MNGNAVCKKSKDSVLQLDMLQVSDDTLEKMKEVVERILPLDDSLRFAGVVDNAENTLYSKMKEDKVRLITSQEEEQFALVLTQINGLQDKLSGKIGKVMFSLSIREKVYQLIYYAGKFTVYVTLEKSVNMQNVMQIATKIQNILKEILLVQIKEWE